MVRKILAAIDRSPMSRVVFEQAIALAKATGANLMLLHVLSSEEPGSPRMQILSTLEYAALQAEFLDDYRQEWKIYEEEGLKLLQSLTDEATHSGVRTEFSQNFGSPGRKICEIAQAWGADLIVISRRGHSSLNELILGSVSNYVFHHTQGRRNTGNQENAGNDKISPPLRVLLPDNRIRAFPNPVSDSFQ